MLSYVLEYLVLVEPVAAVQRDGVSIIIKVLLFLNHGQCLILLLAKVLYLSQNNVERNGKAGNVDGKNSRTLEKCTEIDFFTLKSS